MDRFDAIATGIWDKPLSDVTPQETAELIRQYPFFSAAQMLHLKKLDPGSEEYKQQYQKALLHYHDPLAFETFINPPAHIGFEKKTIPDSDIAQEVLTQQSSPIIEHGIKEAEEAASEVKIKASPSEDTLLFEPYHTVDYFASQGIKNPVDEVPKDKFGKQLKSFTDWLKTMKKIPTVALEKEDTGMEKGVEHLAAHSVEEADVITESMAEVWLKQGNKEKAVQTFRKLSLQNPSKSAYFAAKIEHITAQK